MKGECRMKKAGAASEINGLRGRSQSSGGRASSRAHISSHLTLALPAATSRAGCCIFYTTTRNCIWVWDLHPRTERPGGSVCASLVRGSEQADRETHETRIDTGRHCCQAATSAVTTWSCLSAHNTSPAECISLASFACFAGPILHASYFPPCSSPAHSFRRWKAFRPFRAGLNISAGFKSSCRAISRQ